jgi:hypothetical protein
MNHERHDKHTKNTGTVDWVLCNEFSRQTCASLAGGTGVAATERLAAGQRDRLQSP